MADNGDRPDGREPTSPPDAPAWESIEARTLIFFEQGAMITGGHAAKVYNVQ